MVIAYMVDWAFEVGTQPWFELLYYSESILLALFLQLVCQCGIAIFFLLFQMVSHCYYLNIPLLLAECVIVVS